MLQSETAFNDLVEDLRGRSVNVSRTFLPFVKSFFVFALQPARNIKRKDYGNLKHRRLQTTFLFSENKNVCSLNLHLVMYILCP
jgi:hypothetical protein